MTPETTGSDLLQAVEATLAKEIAPHLTGEARFKTLMAASALRMVIREIAMADKIKALMVAMCAHAGTDDVAALIRSGAGDADAGLHARLLEHARIRSAVARPVSAEKS